MPWYYVRDNQPQGPISDDQLAEFLKSGQLTPDTLVWKEGMAEWKPANVVFTPPTPAVPGIEMLNTPIGGPAESIAAWAGLNSNAPEEPLKFTFTGDWRGYYRVWIIGVVLTVLTLGLYAPWAKIRNKRYLYAHTKLGPDGFGYHANPWSMLAGNLLVAGLFALWLASPLIHAALPYVLIALGLVMLPWILTQSVRFNARATSWRGVRFDFKGSTLGFLWSHVLLPVFSFGVLWPVATRSRRRWLVGNLRYGDTPFRFDASLTERYGIYLQGLIFFVPVGLCYLGLAINAYVDAELARSGGTVYLPHWAMNIAMVGPQIFPSCCRSPLADSISSVPASSLACGTAPPSATTSARPTWPHGISLRCACCMAASSSSVSACSGPGLRFTAIFSNWSVSISRRPRTSARSRRRLLRPVPRALWAKRLRTSSISKRTMTHTPPSSEKPVAGRFYDGVSARALSVSAWFLPSLELVLQGPGFETAIAPPTCASTPRWTTRPALSRCPMVPAASSPTRPSSTTLSPTGPGGWRADAIGPVPSTSSDFCC